MTTTDVDFRTAGLCAQTDPEAFYPDHDHTPGPAKRICHACPVQTECLEWALTHDERYGIWGGLDPNERAQLRRRLALPSRTAQQRTDKRDTARRMHARGRSKAEIARALGLSGTTLNAYLTAETAEVPHQRERR